ncbi:MAG: alpha/beta hydrolase [Actinomycetota bacterium]
MAIKDRIERRVAPAIMKLPHRALRKMAGDPLVIDGRTLDVRLQLAAKQAARNPPLSSLDVPTARAAANDGLAQGNGPRAAGVAVRDRAIGTHGLRVRIYQPPEAEGHGPGVVFFHQGGFVVGDLDSCDTFCSRLSAELGAVVVSLDYRLAPDHRYPAQADDADEAWTWVVEHADALGIDPNRLAVCGDSAGGQMSATLSQRLRDAGDGVQPCAQVLIYPFVDATADDGSMVSCADTFPLSTDTMDWFESQYLADGADRADPSISPALAPSLAGLPPAIVVTAGFDPLRDQGLSYALALRAAGVHVIDRCEDSLSHSFLSFGGLVPDAAAAQGRILDDLRPLLA